LLNSSDATDWTVEPPTSWLMNAPRRTPGISTPTVKGVRELGIAETISWVIDTCRVVLARSTVGVSPLTVMVSCRLPTRISAPIVTVAVPINSTASRTTVANPVRVNVTV
jgi:hypothetical protein